LFLGYDPHRKGYLYLTYSCKFIFSRHVLFNEFIFPYSMPNSSFKLFDNIDIAPHTSPSPLIVVFLPPAPPPPHNPTESLNLLPSASPSMSSSPSLTLMAAPYLNVHPMITCAKDGIYKSIVFQSSVIAYSFEPSTYRQAMIYSDWLQAMHMMLL